MENQAIKGARDWCFSCTVGDWSVTCSDKIFTINKHGIKLYAHREEELSKIIFDAEKKTIRLVINNPRLTASKMPRYIDLNDAPSFFDELYENIETILLTGQYSKVTPNEDRTIFDVE